MQLNCLAWHALEVPFDIDAVVVKLVDTLS